MISRKFLPVLCLPLLLILIIPLAYSEGPITIPISFQEVKGISGGSWSVTVTNNTTTVQLSGVSNNNSFDVVNIEAQIDMYKDGQILCSVVDTISSLGIDENKTFSWTCPTVGIADEADGIILGYDLPSSNQEIPAWVKGVAQFWVEGNINDSEFGEAITFLIEEEIITIDSVNIQNVLPISDEEKRLYDLEISQKDVIIASLKNEIETVGLDNSHLLNSIVEKENTIMNLQNSLDQVNNDFQQYKDDYPLKVGNIGGSQVNADTVQQLEQRNIDLELIIQELEAEIQNLKNN